MMTDREILELAAKAAGIEFNDKRTSYTSPALYRGVAGPVGEHGWWNPLADDGDALRLAVKLGFCMSISPKHHQGAQVAAGSYSHMIAREHAEDNDDDLSAATRRAIVRAAADIGAGMQELSHPSAASKPQAGPRQ